MESINLEVKQIFDILGSFVKSKKIVKEDVDRVFGYSKMKISQRQIRVISDKRLSLEGQRTIFGALRTIKVVLDSMHISLLKAIEVGENPTTAERCMEVVPLMMDLSKEISKYDPYIDKDAECLEHIFNSSRSLRRRAAITGFLKSADQQFNELSINKKEIEEFIDNLNETIQNRLQAS